MDELGAARLAEGLRHHTAGLADAVRVHDPSAPVPTCPEWTLRDLVGHLGQVQRWVIDLIRAGGADVLGVVSGAAPGSPAEWPRWLRDGAEDLIAAYEANPDGTAAHPAFGMRPTLMLLRRVTHETSVHHADAALAAGLPFSVAPDLGADAISEFLDLLSSPVAARHKPGIADLRGDGETIHLRSSEPSRPGWLITRTPEGPVWEHADGPDTDHVACGGADVTVTGPVGDLLLVLLRRQPPDGGVTVTGDRALLDHWLARTAV
jgi:uncharacterized protein (TIGR03083 family)